LMLHIQCLYNIQNTDKISSSGGESLRRVRRIESFFKDIEFGCGPAK
jgi:hypothetical protein